MNFEPHPNESCPPRELLGFIPCGQVIEPWSPLSPLPPTQLHRARGFNGFHGFGRRTTWPLTLEAADPQLTHQVTKCVTLNTEKILVVSHTPTRPPNQPNNHQNPRNTTLASPPNMACCILFWTKAFLFKRGLCQRPCSVAGRRLRKAPLVLRRSLSIYQVDHQTA